MQSKFYDIKLETDYNKGHRVLAEPETYYHDSLSYESTGVFPNESPYKEADFITQRIISTTLDVEPLYRYHVLLEEGCSTVDSPRLAYQQLVKEKKKSKRIKWKT